MTRRVTTEELAEAARQPIKPKAYPALDGTHVVEEGYVDVEVPEAVAQSLNEIAKAPQHSPPTKLDESMPCTCERVVARECGDCQDANCLCLWHRLLAYTKSPLS